MNFHYLRGVGSLPNSRKNLPERTRYPLSPSDQASPSVVSLAGRLPSMHYGCSFPPIRGVAYSVDYRRRPTRCGVSSGSLELVWGEGVPLQLRPWTCPCLTWPKVDAHCVWLFLSWLSWTYHDVCVRRQGYVMHAAAHLSGGRLL